MPCFQPLKAYAVPGRKGLIWSGVKAGPAGRPVSIPCGKCLGCLSKRATDWGLRCKHEATMHPVGSCWFFTLTYADQHLPKDGGLCRRDLVLFIRRLRKALGLAVCKHLGCGEYGGQFGRPHFHLIVFGLAEFERRKWGESSPGVPNWRSDEIEALWGLGQVHIQPFSAGHGFYAAKYVTNGEGDYLRRPHLRPHPVTGEVHMVAGEFMTMTRGGCSRADGSHIGGLSRQWFDRFGGDAFPSDFIVSDGQKFGVPRYYMKRLQDGAIGAGLAAQIEGASSGALFTDAEATAVELHVRRQAALRVRAADATPERLAVREEVARRNLRKREFDGVGE